MFNFKTHITMKKTIITIALLVIAMTASAQDRKTSDKPYKREGDTFVQTKSSRAGKSADEPTAYTWKDSKGNEYPIILHTYTKGEKAGKITCYVIKTSAKTGKEYKYYIPNGEAIAEEILKENL